jgi:hypothetical protein
VAIIAKIILKSDWERNKKDKDISPCYHIRNELYVAEGLVFRLNQIIVPRTLQEKVTKAHAVVCSLSTSGYLVLLSITTRL